MADSFKQLSASASSHDTALHQSRKESAALEVIDPGRRPYLPRVAHAETFICTVLFHDANADMMCCTKPSYACWASAQAELLQWRSKLAASGREWTARNEGLRAQTHTLRRHCSDLRNSMSRFQADHEFDLRQLCVERWAGRLFVPSQDLNSVNSVP